MILPSLISSQSIELPCFFENVSHMFILGHFPEPTLLGECSRCSFPTGMWVLFDDPQHAFQAVQSIKNSHPGIRILLGYGDCFCASSTSWTSPVIDELEPISLQIQSGHVVMTSAFKMIARQWFDEGTSLVALRGMNLSPSTVDLFVLEDLVSPHVRSNLTYRSEHLVGRDAICKELLARLTQPGAHEELTGGLGVGKSALAHHLVQTLLQRDGHMECWWIDATHMTSKETLIQHVASTWNSTISAEETQWASQLMKVICARSVPRLIVLDGLDHLDSASIAWLHELIECSHDTCWLSLSRHALYEHDTSWHHTLLEPLSHTDSLAMLLAPDRTSTTGMHTLEELQGFATLCAGHPATLRHIKRHPTLYHASSTLPVLDPEDIAHQSLWFDWQAMSPAQQLAMSILSHFRASASLQTMRQVLAESCQDATTVLRQLQHVGWLQRTSHTHQNVFKLVHSCVHFVRTQMDDAQQHHTKDLWHRSMVEQINQWCQDLHTASDVRALAQLVTHHHDMIRALDYGLELRAPRTLETIARMRHYYQRHHTLFLYLPLLERAAQIARDDAHTHLLYELTLSHAVLHDHTGGEMKKALKLFELCLEHLDDLCVESRIDALYFYAACVEDSLNSDEELLACLNTLEHARSLMLNEHCYQNQRAACDNLQARLEMQRGALGQAFELAQRAYHDVNASGATVQKGLTAFTLHRVEIMQGHVERALVLAQRAQRAFDEAGYVSGSIMAHASVGYVHLKCGQGLLAQQALTKALLLARTNGHIFGEMNCTHLLGVAYLVSERWDDALHDFLYAQTLQRQLGVDWNYHQTGMMMSLAYSGRGDVLSARQSLEKAAQFFADQPNDDISQTLAYMAYGPRIYETAWIREDVNELDELEQELRALSDGPQEFDGACSGLLFQFIAQARSHVHTALMPALRVREDNASFQLPGEQEFVDLRRRRTVQRVFDALVQGRIEQPGQELSAHELVEKGWPNDKAKVRSGLMRLYVTINTLRNLGLSELLQTYGEGYRLDPSVPITQIRK